MTWCLQTLLLSVTQGPQGFTGPAGEPGEPGASVSSQHVLYCSTKFCTNKMFIFQSILLLPVVVVVFPVERHY